jgi:hypothetical protein
MSELDHQNDLQTLANSFAPTIITAPTARNGITLLQRLLNSTRQTMVFGENQQLVATLPNMAVSGYVTHHQAGEELRQSREKFLNDTTEYWSSNLWPDTERYMLLGFEMFYKAVQLYQQSAREYGFQNWGIKNPMTSPNMVHQLGQLLRSARFVAIYRNPFDVVASAKARRFVISQQDVAKYAQQWQANLQALRERPPQHLLLIRHETLTAEPEPTLRELEQFTGISGIDRSVLERKINTFAGSAGGHAANEYVEPESLDATERELIQTHASEGLEWAGYTQPAA